MPQTAGKYARMPPMLLEAWPEALVVISMNYLGGFHYQGTALKFFPTAEGYVQATPLKVGYAYNYVYSYTAIWGTSA